MPNIEEHCQDTYNRYGYDFREIHKWLDEPSRIAGSKHRVVRHDPFNTPQEAEKIFWDKVPEEQKQNIKHAVLDHIKLDVERTSFKIQSYHLDTIKNQMIADINQFIEWWQGKLGGKASITGEKIIPILSEAVDKGTKMISNWQSLTKDLELDMEYKEWLEDWEKKILDMLGNQIYDVIYTSLQSSLQNALENPDVDFTNEQRKSINNFLKRYEWFKDSSRIKSISDYTTLKNEIIRLDETKELEGLITLLNRVEEAIEYNRLKEKLEMCCNKIR